MLFYFMEPSFTGYNYLKIECPCAVTCSTTYTMQHRNFFYAQASIQQVQPPLQITLRVRMPTLSQMHRVEEAKKVA